ncbi:MAG: hypothetical protein KAH22_02725 [Thiotrichaceae bacterium]|nr:hypothetical protein [Thiotrichaceae bacterium]
MVAIFTNSIALANKSRSPRRLKIIGIETAIVIESNLCQDKTPLHQEDDMLFSSFKLIEVIDKSNDNILSKLLDAKLVGSGLDNGETVVFLSQNNSGTVLSHLDQAGLDMERLRTQWKFIIYTFTEEQTQSDTIDFPLILSEIKNIARGKVDRIILSDIMNCLTLDQPKLAHQQLESLQQAVHDQQLRLFTHYNYQSNYHQKVIERIAQMLVSHYFVALPVKSTKKNGKLKALRLVTKKFF